MAKKNTFLDRVFYYKKKKQKQSKNAIKMKSKFIYGFIFMVTNLLNYINLMLRNFLKDIFLK